jgi:hypothetical protein
MTTWGWGGMARKDFYDYRSSGTSICTRTQLLLSGRHIEGRGCQAAPGLLTLL